MAEKRRSPCTMSLKAHAFSVEALIGAEKRRKLEDEDSESCFGEVNEVASLAGSACGGGGGRNCDTDCDASRKFLQLTNTRRVGHVKFCIRSQETRRSEDQ